MAQAAWINKESGHLRLSNNGNYKWWVPNNCYWYVKNLSTGSVKVDGTNTDQPTYDLHNLDDGVYRYNIQVYEEPGKWVTQAEGYFLKDYASPTLGTKSSGRYKNTANGTYRRIDSACNFYDNAGLNYYTLELEQADSEYGAYQRYDWTAYSFGWPNWNTSGYLSYEFTWLPANKWYRVRYAANDFEGKTVSAYSPSFYIPYSPSAPTNIKRDSVSPTSVTVKWDAPAGELDQYRYTLQKLVGSTWTNVTNHVNVWTGDTTKSRTFTGLDANTQYRLLVAGENHGGVGSTGTGTFWTWDTLAPQTPNSLSSYFDFDRSTKDSVDITFDNSPSWLFDPGGEGFDAFYLSVVPQGFPRSYVKLADNTGIYTATGLSYGTIYEIALQSRDLNGNASAPITTLYYHTKEMTKRHSNDYDPFKRGYPRSTKRPDRNG